MQFRKADKQLIRAGRLSVSFRARRCQRAADLAASSGWETRTFKEHVRRLRKLGLTLSLRAGYRLSPRGEQMLDLLYRKAPPHR